MLGTIVNTACIIAGTLIGTFFKKGLGEKYTKTLFHAMVLAAIALGEPMTVFGIIGAVLIIGSAIISET